VLTIVGGPPRHRGGKRLLGGKAELSITAGKHLVQILPLLLKTLVHIPLSESFNLNEPHFPHLLADKNIHHKQMV
jgi:hypothetical protein